MLWELVRKDLRVFAADRKGIIVTVAVPIALASFMALVFGGMSGGGGAGTPPAVPVVLVDQDDSDLSRAVAADLSAGGAVVVRTLPAAEVEAAVRSGKQAAAVVLSAGFGRQAAAAMAGGGDPPGVRLLYDPSKAMEAQVIRGALVQSVMQAVGRGPQTRPAAPATAAAGATPGPAAERRGGFAAPFRLVDEPVSAAGPADPGAARRATVAHAFVGMTVQGVLFFAIEAAMGLIRDRNRGVWRRLRAAPVSRAALLGGKALSTAAIATGVMGAVLLFGALVFGVRVAGSPVGFVLVCLATAAMVAALGLLIATLGRTEAQSRGLAILAVLVMSMLGGAWFPTFMMPAAIRPVTAALPSRWAVDGLDAMTWRGGGLADALGPTAALLGFAAVFGLAAVAWFRWDGE